MLSFTASYPQIRQIAGAWRACADDRTRRRLQSRHERLRARAARAFADAVPLTDVSLTIRLGPGLWIDRPQSRGQDDADQSAPVAVPGERPARSNGSALRSANAARSARVGYVHENHAFPRYLTPAALLEYYGALSLVPYEQVKKRVPVLLERVGLADRADDAIRTFSKGMIQRLGIAQALINDPELLVLDEPNEGLDLWRPATDDGRDPRTARARPHRHSRVACHCRKSSNSATGWP